MLDDSVFFENSGAVAEEGATDGSGSEAAMIERGFEEDDRSSSGSRWPREETIALLKIRSDMDVAFRDNTPRRAPLWDEVSRKLSELGYHRSAKKCKEKFENIFKYHKRTKESRSSKHNARNYRFFEQLELLDSHFSNPSNRIPSYSMETTPPTPSGAMPTKALSSGQEFTFPLPDNRVPSVSTSTESSSGKESEGSIKRKRKLVDYFESLMKDVLEKQEELQNKFLEALEKCEKEQIAREEAWKLQEMARMKREKELLAQERAMSEAKDAAVIAFLQKLTQHTAPLHVPDIILFDKPPENVGNALEKHSELQENRIGESSAARLDNSTVESTLLMSTSSRWPKSEVEALIRLKTDLDSKYQGSGGGGGGGPKGSIWEEISTSLKRLGYDRAPKRCKEKWENINKYYKRVKDSKKRRPEDSKTCPYFNLLDSVYAKKSKKFDGGCSNSNLKPEQILMQLISQPRDNKKSEERQASVGEYGESDPQNHGEDDEDDEDDDDENNSGECYQQIVGNNNLSSSLTSLS